MVLEETTVLAEVEEPRGDYWPALILGITAAVSTAWWICSWFVFIKNTPNDYILRNKSNQYTMPISFFWERIAETNGTYIYLAGSLMFTFFSYLIVSVIELIAWILYCNDSPDFFAFYASIIGYYGVVVLYSIPVMFAIMHIAITLKGTITATPGAYCIFLISIGTVFWILNVFVHVYFSDRLVAEVARQNGGFGKNLADECPITQGDMDDESYKVACEALKNAKTDDEAGRAAEKEDEEEDTEAEEGASW